MASKSERSKEFTRIVKRDGCIRPSVVVNEARPKKSPLHDDFEWDDAKAAEEYRLSQARQYIRITPVRVANNKPEQRLVHVVPERVEGPTAVETSREGYYKPMSVVVQNDSEYMRALNELQTQVTAIQRTISELKRHAGEEQRSLLVTVADAMIVAKDAMRALRNAS